VYKRQGDEAGRLPRALRCGGEQRVSDDFGLGRACMVYVLPAEVWP
jgi:hypothetical protein